MRIYLAGPMRGYDRFNFPAFDNAANKLRACGHQVASPAEHDRETGFDETADTLDDFDLAGAFRWDINQIFDSDAVAVLPGWSRSEGARLEVGIANMIGRPVHHCEQLLNPLIAKPADVKL